MPPGARSWLSVKLQLSSGHSLFSSLPNEGQFHYRQGTQAEKHLNDHMVIAKLQEAARANSRAAYSQFATLHNNLVKASSICGQLQMPPSRNLPPRLKMPRVKKAKDFSKYEAELSDVVNTLQRAILIIQGEMAKNPAFSQKKNDTRNLNNVAAAFFCVDKQKWVALVQSRKSSDDENGEFTNNGFAFDKKSTLCTETVLLLHRNKGH